MQREEAEMEELSRGFRKLYGFRASLKMRLGILGRFLRRKKWPQVMPFTLVEKIRKEYGDIDYILVGHSHHQFFHVDSNTALVNPGAFGMGFKFPKRSFAVIDTKTWDVVFGKVFIRAM